MAAVSLRLYDISGRYLMAPGHPALQWLSVVTMYLFASEPRARRRARRLWAGLVSASAETIMIWTLLCCSSACFLWMMFGGGAS